MRQHIYFNTTSQSRKACPFAFQCAFIFLAYDDCWLYNCKLYQDQVWFDLTLMTWHFSCGWSLFVYSLVDGDTTDEVHCLTCHRTIQHPSPILRSLWWDCHNFDWKWRWIILLMGVWEACVMMLIMATVIKKIACTRLLTSLLPWIHPA